MYPDLDCLCSLYLLEKIHGEIEIEFISIQTDPLPKGDNILVVDILGGDIDHHDESGETSTCQKIYDAHPEIHSPALGVLVDYCHRSDIMKLTKEETGGNSLKFCIFVTRDTCHDYHLIYQIFKTIANKVYEDPAYLIHFARSHILAMYPSVRKYFDNYEKYMAAQKDWIEVCQIGNLWVAINESEENLTSFIFDNYPHVDLIIYRNPQKDWAGFVKRSEERKVGVDLERIYNTLKEKEKGWFLHKSGNLLLCGTPKAPLAKTTLTVQEMVELLKI